MGEEKATVKMNVQRSLQQTQLFTYTSLLIFSNLSRCTVQNLQQTKKVEI